MQTIDELNAWLFEHNMAGLWTGAATGDEITPHLWKWADIEQGVMAASKVVPIDSGGRRTINVRHPDFPDRMSNTLHMSVQCVLPGEVATTHRHNAAAMRFIIKGSPKAFTAVEGEPMPMETGDLVTTPGWTWHDHHNEGDEPIIWLDGLDIRFIGVWHLLWEEFGGQRQPLNRPARFSQKVLGHAKPSWLKSEHLTPPFRYPWAETQAALEALRETEAEGDPYDGLQVMYTHPVHGGPTLPTFACELQLLTPHRKLKAHRHMSTTLYYAFRGAGTTVVAGQPLEWAKGDIFLVPPWAPHSHENRADDDAILFSMDDWPAVSALGLYREEEVSE
jgi:gentisate 1,2-dioxygenase